MRSALLTLGVLAAGVVLADAVPAPEMIKNRIANFREIGTAFKAINDELRSAQPYLPSVAESARQIESIGADIVTWFPPGSGPAAQPEQGLIDTILGWFTSAEAAPSEGQTHAKPAVWTQRRAFEEAYRAFHAQALKMSQAAQSGDAAAAAAQARALGATCKRCHETFREKLDDEA